MGHALCELVFHFNTTSKMRACGANVCCMHVACTLPKYVFVALWNICLVQLKCVLRFVSLQTSVLVNSMILHLRHVAKFLLACRENGWIELECAPSVYLGWCLTLSA